MLPLHIRVLREASNSSSSLQLGCSVAKILFGRYVDQGLIVAAAPGLCAWGWTTKIQFPEWNLWKLTILLDGLGCVPELTASKGPFGKQFLRMMSEIDPASDASMQGGCCREMKREEKFDEISENDKRDEAWRGKTIVQIIRIPVRELRDKPRTSPSRGLLHTLLNGSCSRASDTLSQRISRPEGLGIPMALLQAHAYRGAVGAQ